MSYCNKKRCDIGTSAGSDPSLDRTQTPIGEAHLRQSAAENLRHGQETREYSLDRTLSETFPCSDPLSSIPNPASDLFL